MNDSICRRNNSSVDEYQDIRSCGHDSVEQIQFSVNGERTVLKGKCISKFIIYAHIVMS